MGTDEMEFAGKGVGWGEQGSKTNLKLTKPSMA